jgi:hypothetical protein
MSLGTKASGMIGATILLVAGGYAALHMTPPSTSSDPPSVPRGASLSTVRRGTEVRLFATWERPYTPARVTTFANDGRRNYFAQQLPALVGHVTYVYAYDPAVVYSITIEQHDRDARSTGCEIVVGGVTVDHNSRDGVSMLTCTAHG